MQRLPEACLAAVLDKGATIKYNCRVTRLEQLPDGQVIIAQVACRRGKLTINLAGKAASRIIAGFISSVPRIDS